MTFLAWFLLGVLLLVAILAFSVAVGHVIRYGHGEPWTDGDGEGSGI